MLNKIVDDMKVIALDHITPNHVKYYRVVCTKCGMEKLIQLSRLNSHTGTHHSNRYCGVYLPEYDPNIGMTVNDYTIIRRLNKKFRKAHYYLAKCNICGMTFETLMGDFKRGYGTHHSMCILHIPSDPYIERFMKIYSCMRYRTTNPNYSEYKYYGGRGISSEYYSDFMRFYNDLYKSYKEHVDKYGEKNTSIDRIDVNGNYELSNVRWATCKEQVMNRRISK